MKRVIALLFVTVVILTSCMNGTVTVETTDALSDTQEEITTKTVTEAETTKVSNLSFASDLKFSTMDIYTVWSTQTLSELLEGEKYCIAEIIYTDVEFYRDFSILRNEDYLTADGHTVYYGEIIDVIESDGVDLKTGDVIADKNITWISVPQELIKVFILQLRTPIIP